jgi:hypothetical protein
LNPPTSPTARPATPTFDDYIPSPAHGDVRIAPTPTAPQPRLSHPSICTPTHRISHHHRHHTWRLLHYLPHLPSNTHGQTRRHEPLLLLRKLCRQAVHLPIHWKRTAQWRETRRNHDCRTPKPPQFATTCLKTGTQDQKGLKRNGTVRENKFGEPRPGPFGPRIGFSQAQIHHTHALNSKQTPPPPRPRRRKHVQAPTPTLQAIIFFLNNSLSKKGGGAGWVGAQQRAPGKTR